LFVQNITAACFDSGGIRSIFAAIVMKNIMDKLGQRTRKTEFVHDYFDMLAGTNSGGLLALFLARLQGVPGQEIVNIYRILSESLYGGPSYKKWGLWGTSYSDIHLESEVRKAVGTYVDVGAPLYDERTPAVLVVAAHRKDPNGKPLLIRSYDQSDRRTTVIEAIEAALAPSAAPTYLPKVEPKPSELVVNGEFEHNNPTQLLIKEALRKY